MSRALLLLALILLETLSWGVYAEDFHIVFIRHAEKPALGRGQLNCQGLQRALALPPVLLKQRGQPTQMMAPNPGIYKKDHGVAYAYIRPLATLEPSAIRFGLPIDTHLGYADSQALAQQLNNSPDLSVIWVAWEHHLLVDTERELMAMWKQPINIADWPDLEFDRIDIIDVQRNLTGIHVSYHQEHEHLNNLPTTCP
ncbi:MAG: hypothetical protein HKM02_03150 [Pseudomonadales bacterium]|nr:hypothetical protein [Pseudomonadales bacterium]